MFDWAFLRPWEPRMRGVLRIMIGLLYLEHGTAKLLDFPATQNHRPYDLMTLSPGLSGLLEFFGGLLIVIGLTTRPVAFILSGEMAFAYFMAHAPRGFFPLSTGGNGGELAIVYCFVFLYFFVVGAGAWAVDNLWATRGEASAAAPSRA